MHACMHVCMYVIYVYTYIYIYYTIYIEKISYRHDTCARMCIMGAGWSQSHCLPQESNWQLLQTVAKDDPDLEKELPTDLGSAKSWSQSCGNDPLLKKGQKENLIQVGRNHLWLSSSSGPQTVSNNQQRFDASAFGLSNKMHCIGGSVLWHPLEKIWYNIICLNMYILYNLNFNIIIY